MDLSIRNRVAQFRENNRGKVDWLISEWPKVEPGERELLFKRNGTTFFRAVPGVQDHLIIRHVAGTAVGAELVRVFGGEELQKTVRVPLDPLLLGDLELLLIKLKR